MEGKRGHGVWGRNRNSSGELDGRQGNTKSDDLECESNKAFVSISVGEKVPICLPLLLITSSKQSRGFIEIFWVCQAWSSACSALGCISDAVADAAGQDVTILKIELRSSQEKRWQVVGNIFSMGSLPWNLKRDSIEFVLVITDNVDKQRITEDTTGSFYYLRLIAALQIIATTVMYASDAALRKNAFTALKRVLTDSPAPLRLDILQHVVRSSNSSSMVAILLDYSRENLQAEICKKRSAREAGADPCSA